MVPVLIDKYLICCIHVTQVIYKQGSEQKLTLDDISFTAENNSLFLIVGQVGSGKVCHDHSVKSNII